MNSQVETAGESRGRWIAFAAAFVAVLGLADAVYLTVHHYTATPVPCSIFEGCETVLTSLYAEFAGIPTAAFGALAYFVAFLSLY
jgi:uncharacterized membrane protein